MGDEITGRLPFPLPSAPQLAHQVILLVQLCISYPRDVPSYKQMRVFRQFAVLVLVLVTCVAPTMACMAPDAQLSAPERACCRKMSKQCGHMEMPASHGCCQKTSPNLYNNSLSTRAVTFHPVVATVFYLATSKWLTPVSLATEWVERPDYSPPESPPSSVPILRI